MANKRQLKKYIRYVSGDIASEILVASAFDSRIDRAKVEEIIRAIAKAQTQALDHCSFSFDRAVKDFETPAAYRKARHAYNKMAFDKVGTEFRQAVEAIVKEMNEALPQQVKDENKKALAKK